MTSIHRFGWTAFALFALVGCEPTTPPATNSPAPAPSTEAPKAPSEVKALPVEPAKPEEPKVEPAKPEEPKADANKLSDEEIAEIKKLPADEQPIALAQMTCPVSGDHLGEMGKPVKQKIGDTTFYLCCSGCEKAVKSKPDEVLAKLKK